MCSHLLGESTHSNTRKVVDGESDVAGVFLGEETFQVGPQGLVCHTCPQLGHTHLLRDELKQDLDKDTAARRRFVLVEVDDGQAVPAKGV